MKVNDILSEGLFDFLQGVPPVIPGFELLTPNSAMKRQQRYKEHWLKSSRMAKVAYDNKWTKQLNVVSGRDSVLSNPNASSQQVSDKVKQYLFKYMMSLYSFYDYNGNARSGRDRESLLTAAITNKFNQKFTNPNTQRAVLQYWIYYSLIDRDNVQASSLTPTTPISQQRINTVKGSTP